MSLSMCEEVILVEEGDREMVLRIVVSSLHPALYVEVRFEMRVSTISSTQLENNSVGVFFDQVDAFFTWVLYDFSN